MTWARSWAGEIALLAFGVSLPLVVAEGVLRVMARRERGGKEQVERNQYTESDPVLGWRKRPGAHATYVRRTGTRAARPSRRRRSERFSWVESN
ncbi:MAG TPA: hypothetical protein PKU70_09975 [Vicinamibacteria bacterium]|nr:hypothetical protein [Vicinamibacteria bacterium]